MIFLTKAPLPKDAGDQVRWMFLRMFYYGPGCMVAMWLGGGFLLREKPVGYLAIVICFSVLARVCLQGYWFAASVAVGLAIGGLSLFPPGIGLVVWGLILTTHAALCCRHYVYIETAAPVPLADARRLREAASGPLSALAVIFSPVGILWGLRRFPRLIDAWRSWVAYNPPTVPGLINSPVGSPRARGVLICAATGFSLFPVLYALRWILFEDFPEGLHWEHSIPAAIAMFVFGFFFIPGTCVLLTSLGAVAFFLSPIEGAQRDVA
jgi:hypothetical protein